MKKLWSSIFMLLFFSSTAIYTEAAIIVVSNSNNSGAGSLRQAVIDAVAGDEIKFAAGTNGNTIVLSSSISITKNLTITGNGIANTIIDGGKNDRVFWISGGATVNILGLIVQNGQVIQNGSIGGGILCTGNLNMVSCWVRGNQVFNSLVNSTTNGGGIYVNGELSMTNCVVSGNFALSTGGGIYSTGGNFILTNTTVVGNSAFNYTTETGQTINSSGGGIRFASGSESTKTLRNCIVWDNYSINNSQIFGSLNSITYQHSIVQDMNLTSVGTGNLNGTLASNAPNFIYPNTITSSPSIKGDFRLLVNSPLIDKGNNTYNSTPIDIALVGRTFDGDLNGITTIDLGAFEFNNYPSEFITRWKTDNTGPSNDNQITIPIFNFGTYNYNVSWGDGTVSTGVSSSITHTYSSPGIYTVIISGTYPRIVFGSISDKQKILSVLNWGNNPWTSMSSGFKDCINLTIETPFPPNLSAANSTVSMFEGATSVNGNLERWDVGSITFFGSMFRNATSFNGNIANWNVSNAVNFVYMFAGATAFNRNIGSWNVGNAIVFSRMFQGATIFNGDISNWNTGSGEDFSYMFNNATSFNRDIGNWDVSSATTFAHMFENATSFDQNLGRWDISSLETTITQNAYDMFLGVKLSVANYDSLLIGWNTLDILNGETRIPSNLVFDGGNSQYCQGAAARANLDNVRGWTITDGGSASTAFAFSVTACESYTVPSGNKTYTTSGIYLDTIPNNAGCDSLLTINVTINNPTNGTAVITACNSYIWVDGNTYTASNNTATYTFANSASNGCDSVVTLDLTILPLTGGRTTVSACDSYIWNSNIYTTSGLYLNSVACNVDTLDLTITPTTGSTTSATACNSYLWTLNGQTYTASGIYTDSNNCHIDTLDLTITPLGGSTITETACGSFMWSLNNQTYTSSGTYIETGSCGADTLVLTITPITGSVTTVSACDSYMWNSNIYTASGMYFDSVSCNVDTLNLTITPTTGKTYTESACGNFLWNVNSTTYTQSGTYVETVGCQSDTLVLTITPISGSKLTTTACDNYTWNADGATYTSSGTYYFTDGCQNDTLVLTINQSTSNTTTISAVGSYTWSVNGMTYTQSGTYTFTNTNGAGCPNVETLNLTITTASPVTVTVSSPGLNAAWKSYGANNPNMFYYGIPNSQRINAKVVGGVGPFTYSWSNSGGTNFLLPRTYYPANSIDILEPTAATTITVVVTDQGTGSQYTRSMFMDWTDEFFCYKIGNTWYIKICQDGQSVCVPWTTGRDLLRDGLATLGNCSNKFSIESTELSVDIFPNPTNGVFGLLVKNAQNSVHVEIFDMNGKRLGVEELPIQRGVATHEFSFTLLPAGMYYVQVNDGDIFITKKLVIQD